MSRDGTVQESLDTGVSTGDSTSASMRTKGAMKLNETWSGKEPGNPPISQVKAGYVTYIFLQG